jgi:hypothetical protein
LALLVELGGEIHSDLRSAIPLEKTKVTDIARDAPLNVG